LIKGLPIYEILLFQAVLPEVNNLIHLSVKRLTLLFSLVYSRIQVDRNRKQKDSGLQSMMSEFE